MELPSKTLEQTAFNTRPYIEEHILNVMEKSTHEKHFSQPLQTNKKQFIVTVTSLNGYKGIFNVTNKNMTFYFSVSNRDDNLSLISIPPGAYAIERLNNETK